MLEAQISEGGILKKIIDSIKDLVTDANFDCSSTGIQLQAMDSSHVSLVALYLKKDGFDHFRCDRNSSLGINMASMAKIMKCASNDDSITLKAEDGGDSVGFMFEAKNQTRISHFSLKLIDIDSEHLGIPDTEYKTTVRMPSSEFQRICRELAVIGDTVSIHATKGGVKFGVTGDLGSGDIVLKQSAAVDEKDEDAVLIKLEEEVNLTFALRYLNSFAKATPLASHVTLKMSPDVPLVVEYQISNNEDRELGHIRFYLAPKIEEEAPDAAGAGAAAQAAVPPEMEEKKAAAATKNRPKAETKLAGREVGGGGGGGGGDAGADPDADAEMAAATVPPERKAAAAAKKAAPAAAAAAAAATTKDKETPKGPPPAAAGAKKPAEGNVLLPTKAKAELVSSQSQSQSDASFSIKHE